MTSDPVPDDLFNGSAVYGPAAYSEQPSDNVHACTPKRELAIVRAFAPIALDPSGNAHSTVGAAVEWWGPDAPEHRQDGLVESWSRVLGQHPGIAFCNPPYGRRIVPWIAKMNAEGAFGAEIVALLPGRFDTKWFRAIRAMQICWYGRRIAFSDPARVGEDSAKFPSVFAYWGCRPLRFVDVFGRHGVVTTWAHNG